MLVSSTFFDYYTFNVSWTLLPHVASTQYIVDFTIEQKVLEIVQNTLNRFTLETPRSNRQPDISVAFRVRESSS